MTTLEEEGLADSVTGEDSKSEVEAVGGLNVLCVGHQAILPGAAPLQGI